MAENADAAAIGAAYADQVKALYKVLLDNLSLKNKNAVQQFTDGLNVAREARDAALKASGAEVATLAVKRKTKTK